MKPIHLCIGAPRSGTTWLFRELQEQATVFVPQAKEVRYWNSRRSAAEVEGTVQKVQAELAALPDVSDQKNWLEKWQKIEQKTPPTIKEYLELMSVKGVPSVDISPSYCFLPVEKIEILRAGLPKGSKVLYLIRDPMKRLASQLKLHFHLHGSYRGLPAAEDIETFLADANQRKRWNYDQVVESWQSVFKDDFHFLPNKQLETDPKGFIKQISELMGFALGKGMESRDPDSFYHSSKNRNIQPGLPSLGAKERKTLAIALRPDISHFAKRLPNPGNSWLATLDRSIAAKTAAKTSVEEMGLRVKMLMRMTESLGDNCELGFWQRDRAYEPSSLFRWAVTSVESLIAFLENPEKLYAKDKLSVYSPGMVHDATFGFKFNSALIDADNSKKLVEGQKFEEIFAREYEKIADLQDKFSFYLAVKPALYVIKSNSGLDVETMSHLSDLLTAAHKNHIVLWAEQGADGASDTAVKQISDRVFCGRIPEFAKCATADKYHPSGWSNLMRQMAEIPIVSQQIDVMFR